MKKTVRVKGKAAVLRSEQLARSGGRGVTLRIAGLKDVEAVERLENRAFDPRLYAGAIMTRRAIRHVIGTANAAVVLAEAGGQVAGYGLISFRRDSGKARFYSLAVDPDFQGQGIGTLLFAAAELIGRTAGADTLLLEIREDNKVLKKRYEGMGYEVYRHVPEYYGDGAGALKMWRTLDRKKR